MLPEQWHGEIKGLSKSELSYKQIRQQLLSETSRIDFSLAADFYFYSYGTSISSTGREGTKTAGL